MDEAEDLDRVCPNDVWAILEMGLSMSVLLPGDVEKVRWFRVKVKLWKMMSYWYHRTNVL